MKITLIGFDIWGYLKEVANYLEKQQYEVTYINTSLYQYKHKSLFHKAKNFFSKIFLGKNLKKYNRDVQVISLVPENQDIIFVINPGEYFPVLTEHLRKNTKQLIGWNYDSNKRKRLTNFHFSKYDKLFSFDRMDCKENENLHFLPNFIYKDHFKRAASDNQYKAYTIINKDLFRLNILQKIALQLDGNSFLFQVKSEKIEGYHPNIQFIEEKLSLDEVESYLKSSEIMIDILREDKYQQIGLSFRIFDALAFEQKIITTNKDIVHYDFYNPNNIFVIEDVEKFIIPKDFIQSAYAQIPKEMYEKYTLRNWWKQIEKL